MRNIIPISRLRDPDISKILSIRSNTKEPDIHQILDPTEDDVGIGKLEKIYAQIQDLVIDKSTDPLTRFKEIWGLIQNFSFNTK